MSAFTTVPDQTIAKLKQLSKEVEDLTWEYMTFREDKILYSFYEKQNEILNLIKTI